VLSTTTFVKDLHEREINQIEYGVSSTFNVYKIVLPSEYGVSSTFNVAGLSSCDVGVLDAHRRANFFKKKGMIDGYPNSIRT